MVYRKTAKQSYGRQPGVIRHSIISPSHHLTFRSQWEANLENAIAKANALKNEGYLVEEALERGALTQSQAERIINRLKASGFELQTIPITTWAGEQVVFVVYKPPPEPVQPKPPPQPAKPKTKQPPSPDQLKDKFVEVFFGKYDPNDVDVQQLFETYKNEGWMMNPTRIAAFISKDTKSTKPLIETFKTLVNPIMIFPNASKVMSALRRAKTEGKFAYVKFGDAVANIDYVIKALRVIGRGEIRVYSEGAEKPIYFSDYWGNGVVVAPATTDVPQLVIDAQTQLPQYEK